MIETKRLFLRPLALSDEKDLLEYQSIPEVVRYIPWPERTPEQVHEALLKAISQNDVVNEGDWIVLAIVSKETKKVIGQLNLSIKNSVNKYGEFGYVINPAYSGNGYVTEAAKALLTWAFANNVVAPSQTTAVPAIAVRTGVAFTVMLKLTAFEHPLALVTV